MIFLMIFSVVGFAMIGGLGNVGGGFQYEGHSFEVRVINGNQMIFTEVNNVEVGFYTDPFNAQSINFEQEAKEHLRTANTVYLVTNPDDIRGIETEILLRDYQNFANRNVIRAYTERDPFDPLPVISCEDATPDEAVLLVENQIGNMTTGITKETDYCYRVQGLEIDIIFARDYLLYNDLGIIR